MRIKDCFERSIWKILIWKPLRNSHSSSHCLDTANFYWEAWKSVRTFCQVSGHADLSKLCNGGGLDEALHSVELMDQQGVPISKHIIYWLLRECSQKEDLGATRRIHSLMISHGLESVSILGDHLIRLFASCGSLAEANNAFCRIMKPSMYSWTAIISAHAKLGQGEKALHLYYKMQQLNVRSNEFVYVAVLKACSSIANLTQGRLIHAQIIERGIEADVIIGSTLIDMYAKCGSLEEARKVFDMMPNRNVVSWCAMIVGYSQHGHGLLALDLFENMQHEGIKPDKVTFLGVLKACSSIGAIEYGRLIQEQILSSGLATHVVIGNALIDMYAKCGSLEEANLTFTNLPNRDRVSWGTMIEGYALHGYGISALNLFKQMQNEGIKPNKVIFLSILKACSSVGAKEQGKVIHNQIIQSGLEQDVAVRNALIDMYAKCGNLEEAHQEFHKLPKRDVIAWGAMIAGYAQYGMCRVAQQYLEAMKEQGLKPDGAIFTSMLAACSHAGLVEDGCHFFKSMRENYSIIPSIEHCTCMIDLLGRTGQLDEAGAILKTMSIPPNLIGWNSLLTACRTYGNIELGKCCFDELVRLDPAEATAYVLMSNIFADAHMWKDVDRVEDLRKRAGAWKKPGKAWIEVNNEVHEFIVGDKCHPQSNEIYNELKRLSTLMKYEGYLPQLDLVLQPMEDKDKEDALCVHCEKLALAFGLVSTPGGTALRITKNLRVCTDCHNGTKIISEIERREIIIKDRYRIHHFKNGTCSCGDYY